MREDGIHISSPKSELTFIPAAQLKTAVRLDVLYGYNKLYPHHMPMLFITTMTPEELAVQGDGIRCGGLEFPQADSREFRALVAARYLAWHWKQNREKCWVIHYTEKNLRTLQTLYPHIRINELSSGWLKNAEADAGESRLFD